MKNILGIINLCKYGVIQVERDTRNKKRR